MVMLSSQSEHNMKTKNATESSLNTQGKQYFLGKHLKKSSLIEIISKLQEDLAKIKQFTANQINYRTEIEKLKDENKNLETQLRSETLHGQSPCDNTNQIEIYKEQADIRKRLKLNYEKKVKNTIHLYEEKHEKLKKQITDLEKDREAFAEAIEKKQIAICSVKRDIDRIKKDKEDIEAKYEKDLRDEKQKYEEDRKKFEADKEKLTKEMDILQRSYVDLDKIRKYLEKNNANSKNMIADNNRMNAEKLLNLSMNNEEKEMKHLEEIRTMRIQMETVVKETKDKMQQIEKKMKENSDEYECKINTLLKEIETLEMEKKDLERSLQSSDNETIMHKEIINSTKQFYEEKLREINSNTFEEKINIETEVNKLKENYEKIILDLKSEQEKMQNIMLEKQEENKLLACRLAELKTEVDENNVKYVENYAALKQKVEKIKNNYEAQSNNLETKLSDEGKQNANLRKQIAKYESQIISLKYANETMKTEHEQDIEKLWERINNEKNLHDEEIKELKDVQRKKINAIEDDFAYAKSGFDRLQEEFNTLKSDKENLDKIYVTLKEKAEKSDEVHKYGLNQIRKEFQLSEDIYKSENDEIKMDIKRQAKLLQTYEEDIKTLKLRNKDLENTISLNNCQYSEQVSRLTHTIEENKKYYKEDLDNMKEHLNYKDQLINKFEGQLKENGNLALPVTDNDDDQDHVENDKQIALDKIKNNYELQQRKYHILIYEFYKELKEQSIKIEALNTTKTQLETENFNLKSRINEIIANIQTQMEFFQNDTEISKLIESIID